MKKTNLLLTFIVVLIILFLGYHVKIIYDYGIAIKQEVVLRKERQLKIAIDMEFKGTILKKTLSNHQYDGYYFTIYLFYIKSEVGDLNKERFSLYGNLYEIIHPSSIVYRVSKGEYDSFVIGDSIFKEKGSLIIKKLN
jgi:hypothetical protein